MGAKIQFPHGLDVNGLARAIDEAEAHRRAVEADIFRRPEV